MLATRNSNAQSRNDRIRQDRSFRGSNVRWAESVSEYCRPGAVLLIGGADVVDFRVRVAQSHLRQDLLPSYWSMAGVMTSSSEFVSIPVGGRLESSRVPGGNAVTSCRIAEFSDAKRYPNMAVLHFADPLDEIVRHVERVSRQRSVIDLPQLLLAWLGFGWGAATTGNPLMQGLGVPSAALVETAYAMAGIELTPGVSSTASCPEAIWQSALWWHEYYGKVSEEPERRPSDSGVWEPAPIVPAGTALIRQVSAAVTFEQE